MNGRRIVAPAWLLFVLFVVPLAAEAQGSWVIPGDQEPLIGEMLGAPPSPCRLLGASIDQTAIRARYQCAAVQFDVELRHPSNASPEAARTQQFALVIPSAAPPDFGTALVDAVRRHEAAFRWVNTEAEETQRRPQSGSIFERIFAAPSQPRPSFRNKALLGVAAGALAFAAVFALALRAFGRVRTAASEVSREREAIAAPLVFTAALLYYALSSYAAPFNLDTSRDILSARDCLETNQVCDILPPTSIGLFNQGGLFLRLLSLWLALGLPFWALEAGVILFHALSAVCVHLLVRRHLSARLAPVATMFYLVTSLYVLDYPVVFNISVSLLPMAACLLSLMALVATGATAWAVAASVAFTLAADAHVIFLMYLPWLFFAIGATSRRPLLDTALVLVGIAITGAAQSLSTWVANVRFLFDSSTALPTFAGLALAFAGGLGLRSRLAALDPRARCAAMLAAPTAIYFLTYLGASVVLRDSPPMYVVPAQVGLCVAAAALLDLAAGRIAQGMPARQRALLALALPVAAAVHLLRIDHSGPRFWSMREVEKVAHLLYGSGYRFADLRAHLQTSRDGLIAGLGDFEPRTPPAEPAPEQDILLLRVPRSTLPAAIPSTWTVVDLRAGYAAVLRPIRPLLDRQRMEACYAPADGTPGLGGCMPVDIASAVARRRILAGLYTDRMFFAVHEAETKLRLVTMQKQHGSVVHFKVPIAAPRGGAARVIELLPTRFPWRIESAEGVRARGGLPSTQIIVEPDGANGTIVFAGEAPPVEERHELYLPPPVAEMEEDENDLRALLNVQAN